MTLYLPCYLLRAAIGDRRAAFQAGNKPAPKLKITESSHTVDISLATNTGEMCPPPLGPGVLGAKLEVKTYAPLTPTSSPSVEPMIPIKNASVKNKERINLFLAPIAFIVPISFI